jgi:hypothetical protein
MSRLFLAFACFFRVLFGKQLPAGALALLPQTTTPVSQPGTSAAKPATPARDDKPAAKPAAGAAKPAAAATKPAAAATKPAAGPAAGDDKPAPRPDDKPRISAAQHHRDGALALLALLQREGRLVDFLQEPLDGFSDGDIGAAARDVHRGCRKVLAQHLSLEPVMPGAEEAKVSVPKGFDPAEIRLIGEAKGEPPLRGTLRHHGWRVVDARLPALTEGIDRMVIAPAEVEL